MISLFQSTVKSVKIGEKKKCDLSLQVAIEMPSDIRKVYSPTHTINCKVCFFFKVYISLYTHDENFKQCLHLTIFYKLTKVVFLQNIVNITFFKEKLKYLEMFMAIFSINSCSNSLRIYHDRVS